MSGELVCGFNIAKAEFTTDISRKTIHAKLPRAEVLNIVTDVKNIRVYDQKTGLFTADFSFADMNTLLKKVIDDIPQKAEKDWQMFSKTETNARKVIVMLAKEMGFKADVEFIESNN